MATAYSGPAPKHLWIVGILSLLWNCIGATDYVLTHAGSLAWMEMMGLGQAELDFFTSLPTWAVALWAIGVWGSVVGSILLLLRSRHAATAFLLSLIGALASFIAQFTMEKPASLEGGTARIMPAVILIVIGLQWYYA